MEARSSVLVGKNDKNN